MHPKMDKVHETICKICTPDAVVQYNLTSSFVCATCGKDFVRKPDKAHIFTHDQKKSNKYVQL